MCGTLLLQIGLLTLYFVHLLFILMTTSFTYYVFNDQINLDDNGDEQISIYGNLEKSRISHLQKLTKKCLAAPKGLINCASK